MTWSARSLIHLNETLGAPSARAMERLFAAIDSEEARSPRHGRWFDLGSRIFEFLSNLTPRTLARSAIAAAVAILVQAAVINANPLASAPSEGSSAVVRFAPGRPRMTSPTRQPSFYLLMLRLLVDRVHGQPLSTPSDLSSSASRLRA